MQVLYCGWLVDCTAQVRARERKEEVGGGGERDIENERKKRKGKKKNAQVHKVISSPGIK